MHCLVHNNIVQFHIVFGLKDSHRCLFVLFLKQFQTILVKLKIALGDSKLLQDCIWISNEPYYILALVSNMQLPRHNTCFLFF